MSPTSIFRTFLLLSVLIGSSCTYFTEPQALFNAGTLPPTAVHFKATKFTNFALNQLVTGTIGPAFVPEWGTSGTDSVIVFVDSVRLGLIYSNQGYYSPAFTFSINTAEWPNGRHTFRLYTYKTPTVRDSLGLMSLIQSSLYLYETSLVFDNTPPSAPTNFVVATVQAHRPHLSWTPTTLSNFSSYNIRRDGTIIATISTQSVSSYVDSTAPDFYRGNYDVGVSNGPVAAYSQIDSCTIGEAVGFSIDNAIDNVSTDHVVFSLTNKSLAAVSTQTHTVVHQSSTGHSGYWSKSIDNDTLYCWEHSNLFTYPASTLSVCNTQQLLLINSYVTAWQRVLATRCTLP